MARGKKTSEDVIYKVMASYAVTQNFGETARVLNMAKSTVKSIYEKNKDKPEFVQLRIEKKEEFAEKATEIIDKGLEIINRRLTVALEKQEELEQILDEIENTPNEEMSYQEKQAAISAIKETQIQKIKDISTTVGTLYDKRALATGESTQSIEITGNVDIDKLAKLAGYTKNE